METPIQSPDHHMKPYDAYSFDMDINEMNGLPTPTISHEFDTHELNHFASNMISANDTATAIVDAVLHNHDNIIPGDLQFRKSTDSIVAEIESKDSHTLSHIQIDYRSSVEHVCEHLSTLNINGFMYPELVSTFRDEFIDGKLFLNLTKTDLNHLGCYEFAKRNALFKHIQNLKDISVAVVKPEYSDITHDNNDNMFTQQSSNALKSLRTSSISTDELSTNHTNNSNNGNDTSDAKNNNDNVIIANNANDGPSNENTAATVTYSKSLNTGYHNGIVVHNHPNPQKRNSSPILKNVNAAAAAGHGAVNWNGNNNSNHNNNNAHFDNNGAQLKIQPPSSPQPQAHVHIKAPILSQQVRTAPVVRIVQQPSFSNVWNVNNNQTNNAQQLRSPIQIGRSASVNLRPTILITDSNSASISADIKSDSYVHPTSKKSYRNRVRQNRNSQQARTYTRVDQQETYHTEEFFRKSVQLTTRKDKKNSNLVSFPAIFRDYSLDMGSASLLIPKPNINKLNNFIRKYQQSRDHHNVNGSTSYYNAKNVSHSFETDLNIQEKRSHNGWLIENTDENTKHQMRYVNLPHFALVRVTIDLETLMIVQVAPVYIAGYIRNVEHSQTANRFDSVWVESTLSVKAMEYHHFTNKKDPYSQRLQEIISLQLNNYNSQCWENYKCFVDNSIGDNSNSGNNNNNNNNGNNHGNNKNNNGLKHKNDQYSTSCLVNDFKSHETQFSKFDKVEFCMKLAAVSDKKSKSKKRNVFVQAWGVTKQC